jgi:hypothetical protein
LEDNRRYHLAQQDSRESCTSSVLGVDQAVAVPDRACPGSVRDHLLGISFLTSNDLLAAAPSITQLLRPLGTQSLRTQRLMRLSNVYAMHPPEFPTSSPSQDTSKILCSASQLASGEQEVEGDPEFEVASSQSIPKPFSPLLPNLTTPGSFLKQARISPSSEHAEISRRLQSRQYRAAQKASPIAHIPFTGPYAIDSFRIFSPSLPGGGAPSRVEEQLARIAKLPKVANEGAERDDFDETPRWYDPKLLHVVGDEDAEWRQTRPDDKELRRYLVSDYIMAISCGHTG